MKYLFTCKFKNGETIDQYSDDASATTPFKSAFYDIIKSEENNNPPVYFSLSDGKDSYAVDLKDGKFIENGKEKYLSEPQKELLKLVYFRNVSVKIGEDNKKTVFNFGWENSDGEKKIVSIS